MAKGPTVYDVAERAGVSIATVSFTFRQPHRVKESTRITVLEAARELGYLPSGNARGLARGRTGVLGIYTFDYYILNQPVESSMSIKDGQLAQPRSPGAVTNNMDFRLFPLYVDEIQHGVALECWHRGYNLMVSGGSQTQGKSITEIAGQVDGLAVFARSVPDDVLALIAKRIPVVELSEPSHNDSVGHVTVDNAAGTRALTDHLVRAHGKKDLQFAAPADTSFDFRSRFRGFQEALKASGMRVPETPLMFGAGTNTSAHDLVSDLIARSELPEGFVCALDEYALQLMDALSGAGIAVPEQVVVTGFDGIVAGRIRQPALTTVRQPMEAMGRLAAQILIERFEDPTLGIEDHQLPVTLEYRGSCGCGQS